MTTAERKRALKPVPCPACGDDMPAGRLAPNMRVREMTFGVCGQCAHNQRAEAHVPAPMYETDAWSRGIKL